MAESKKQKVSKRIDEAVSALEKKDFTMYFFVADSRNVPNETMEYMYQLAKTVRDNGYNVTMLYQLDNEYTQEELEELKNKELPEDANRTFVGVGDWLGDDYASLPHLNISLGTWTVSPSDFLFIPEAFSSLMFQTHQHRIPCKRIVVLNNFDYVTDMIPFGVEWANYGIHEVVSSTERQLQILKDSFPYVKGTVLPTYIPEYFRKPVKPKNLIVNIVAKEQKDVNRILKPFYWQYPSFRFVSFRELRNFPRKRFAESLQEGAITVWIDEHTPFGNSAVEAIRCGNIVIGKVPENIPEWMGDENGLKDNGVWFTNINDVPKILAEVISSWMNDDIPEELLKSMDETNRLYTYEKWVENVNDFTKGIVNARIKEFKQFKNANIQSKENKEEN